MGLWKSSLLPVLVWLFLRVVASSSLELDAALDKERRSVELFLRSQRVELNISWDMLRRDLLAVRAHQQPGPQSAVMFIHATIGIFKRKRGKPGTWGHGTEILTEMLQAVQDAKALGWFRRIYIGTLGSDVDTAQARAAILARFSGDQWGDKLAFIVSGANLEYSELPTLAVLQVFARLLPQSSSAASLHLLYAHTKGVRKNGDFACDWRQYMMHMLLAHYKGICEPAMRSRGYLSCGALKTPTAQGPIYAGNFWWTTGQYILQSRRGAFSLTQSSMVWSSANRYVAENYLLAGVSAAESRDKHYCLHHTHHDMQNCATPFSLYASASAALRLRSHGNCYSPALRPRNQSKHDRASWCHATALPVID